MKARRAVSAIVGVLALFLVLQTPVRRSGRHRDEPERAMLVHPDERVCYDTRRHGVVLARPLAQAAVLAGLGAFVLVQRWPLQAPGAVLVAAAAAVCLRAVWRWERTRVVVTTEKLLLVDGTLRRRAASVPLRAVARLELEQSFPGRLLGYGTLVAGPLEIDHVPEPRSVYRLVERLAG
jgi:membrane protein YdbS with pleckstrin-like domain